MVNDDRAAGDRGLHTARPRSHLFAVRLWKEDVAGGSEYRGSARDVVSGAYRGFRDWSDLAAFMIERVEEDDPGQRATGTDEVRTTGRRRR
jgi:hypothetical protein